MSDLMRMMRDAAAEPTDYPDVDRAWRRARLHRAAFVSLSLVAVIAVTGGAVIAASSIGESDTRPAPPADIEPGGEGAIAFSRSGSEGGIYVLDPVDYETVRLTSTTGDDQPAWSPDGSRIAFVRYEEGNQDFYVVNADGTGTVRLTDDGASGNPMWSPDGTRIAFQREMDGNADIFVMNADGTDVTRLTDDPLSEHTPAWSPDGTSIAFVGFSYSSFGPTPVRLYVMNADGGGRRQLPAEDVAQPGWSPDGSKIAFVDSQTGSLYVINADGTGLRQVVDLAGVTEGRGNLTMSPSWSPDGTTIAFATGSTATSTHIYLVNEDGSGLLQITDERVSDANPDWGATPADASPEPPDCPAVGEGGYQMTLEPPNPSPGTRVSATGPIPMYGEDGSYSPPRADEAVHFWLDADEERWEDLIEPGLQPDKDPGEGARYLGSQSLADPTLCNFEFAFDMPDVPPGQHSVVPVMFGGGGAAPYDDAVLELIEDRNADQPPCEDDQSAKGYGQTPPGRWLEELLLDLGAPGGHPLTDKDVRDTGTALWIDIPEYGNDPTIYATMLTPGVDPNVTKSETEREIGTRHSYTLYFDDTDYQMESYKAVNDKWQLALLAYPGDGNNDVMWPDDTVEWLRQAVDLAEQSPPQCEGPIT